MPDFPDNAKPYPPRRIFWMTVRTNPVIYRREFQLRDAFKAVAINVATKGYVYVYVNRTLVAAHSPRKPSRTTLVFDITQACRRGKNVMVVSAPGSGFWLGCYSHIAAGKRSAFFSDAAWKAKRFPPLTRLEDLDLNEPGFDTSSWLGVKEIRDEFTPPIPPVHRFREEFRKEACRWLGKLIADTEWKVKLLLSQGIVFDGYRPFTWRGPERYPRELLSLAEKLAGQVPDLRQSLNTLRHKDLKQVDFDLFLGDYARLMDGVNSLADSLDALHKTALLRSRLAALRLAREAIPGIRVSLPREKVIRKVVRGLASGRVPQVRKQLARLAHSIRSCEQAFSAHGWKIGTLSLAHRNPFCWTDDTRIIGSDISSWGVSVRELPPQWYVSMDGLWRFQVDPKNVGLQEKWHSIGYNIELQWRELRVPGSWESQGIVMLNPNAPADNPLVKSRRKDMMYNGYAWYRSYVRIPASWKGQKLFLEIGRVDDWDWVYFNGKEIGHSDNKVRRWWAVPRKYPVPAKLIKFGEENLVAVRVYDAGGDGGLMGSVRVTCPTLASHPTPPKDPSLAVSIENSPLSPGVMLKLFGTGLKLQGWTRGSQASPSHIVVPTRKGAVVKECTKLVYDRKRDGPLAANWLLIWTGPKSSVLLVMEDCPDTLSTTRGETGVQSVTIRFSTQGLRVVAMRPLFRTVKLAAGAAPEPVTRVCQSWDPVLRRYPIEFVEISRRKGKQSELLVAYDYMKLRGGKGTKLALLPPLMSFAFQHKYPGLKLPSNAEQLDYETPGWGRLFGVTDESFIKVIVPAPDEPFLAGYCALFASAVDCTHEGNDIECQLMKDVGANFWRPQFEAADAMPERVRPLWDYCKKYGQRMVINQTHWNLHVDFGERVAKDCKGLSRDTVWYDLINEPAGLAPEPYQKMVEELTRRIRAIDKVHPIIVETPNSYASVTMFPFLKPTGDTNTLYSFHYYSMWAQPGRPYPNARFNRRKLQHDWVPALRFGLQHRVRIHLGEYGTNRPATYVGHIYCINDYLTTCEQFDISSHFWSNRHIVRRLEELQDGSLRLLLFDKAFRDRLIGALKPHYRLSPRKYFRYP